MRHARSLVLALVIGVAGFAVLSPTGCSDAQASPRTTRLDLAGALFVDAVAPAAVAPPAAPKVDPAPAPSIFTTTIEPALVRIALDPTVIGILLGIVFLWFRGKNAARAAKLQSGIAMAFHGVEDLKNTGLLDKLFPGLTKVDVALKKLNDIAANQKLTLTDEEIALAKQAWSAMHGAAATDAPANAPNVTGAPA